MTEFINPRIFLDDTKTKLIVKCEQVTPIECIEITMTIDGNLINNTNTIGETATFHYSKPQKVSTNLDKMEGSN